MTVQDGVQLEPTAGIARINAAPPFKKPIPADSRIEIPIDAHNIDVRVEISDFSTKKQHQFNANFNSVLKSIRIADQSLAGVETRLDQITSEMQTFLKMYPPYPPESEERVRLLKNYAAIRNQIEQLAIPEDSFADLLLRNGPADETAGKYEVKIGDNVIGGRFPGSQKGLDIIDLPELSMMSNDKQITEAAKTLGNLKSFVTRKRNSLMQDVRLLIETVR